jgi:hypothetical protein
MVTLKKMYKTYTEMAGEVFPHEYNIERAKIHKEIEDIIQKVWVEYIKKVGGMTNGMDKSKG